MEIIYKTCPNCGHTNEYHIDNKCWKVCGGCCHIFKDDISMDGIRVLECATEGGLICLGSYYGLDTYIKGAEMACKINNVEIPTDAEMVYGWLNDCGHVDSNGDFHIESKAMANLRIMKGCYSIFDVEFGGKTFTIDCDDCSVAPHFIVIDE